jgi:hypothetical protein
MTLLSVTVTSIQKILHLGITKKLTHAKHAAVTGSKNIIISSSDTDVVVLAIYVFIDLHNNELWIAFGKGKDFRWIPFIRRQGRLGQDV